MTYSKELPDVGFEPGPSDARTVAYAYGAPALPIVPHSTPKTLIFEDMHML